jgi:hypothetical protein
MVADPLYKVLEDSTVKVADRCWPMHDHRFAVTRSRDAIRRRR